MHRRASAVFNLNQYGTKAALLNGIDGIPLNLRSAAASAASGLDFVRESMMTEDNGDRPDVPNAVVVITDSNSDVDVANTVYAAQNLRNAGATVFSIGVGLGFKVPVSTDSRYFCIVLITFIARNVTDDIESRTLSSLFSVCMMTANCRLTIN